MSVTHAKTKSWKKLINEYSFEKKSNHNANGFDVGNRVHQ
jgi:hypothetical protein